MQIQTTEIPGGVCAPKGFLAAGVHCGIRAGRQKRDLALIYSLKRCAAAAVYTQNKVKGAPLAVTRAHLADGSAKAVIVNSGNANTCNANGIEIAEAMCELTAKALDIRAQDVQVASTGVIGQPLSIEPIAAGIPALTAALSPEGGSDACEGIMTTDTRQKQFGLSFTIDGVTCRLGGMCKGSGMIAPNMATMLGFLTTDVNIAPAMLQKALSETITDTFNMVSVDGDTSTNDMVVVLANGEAGNVRIEYADTGYRIFVSALAQLCRQMARAIARDGEGATKLLECHVTGAKEKATARKVAKSVVCSTLLKAAMFGEDANWGRILCAIGYTDANFDIGKVAVTLRSAAGAVQVCEHGAGVPFSEEEAAKVLAEEEIGIEVDLGAGNQSATAWGCDLSYDYVKINGDYRT